MAAITVVAGENVAISTASRPFTHSAGRILRYDSLNFAVQAKALTPIHACAPGLLLFTHARVIDSTEASPPKQVTASVWLSSRVG